MGSDKLWIDVAGRPLIGHTLAAVARARRFDRVVVVSRAGVWDRVRALAHEAGIARIDVVEGGERRQDSVRASLAACAGCDVVCVHDAARPLCPPEVFGAVVDAARDSGAATAVVPLVDSVKRVDAAGVVVETIARRGLVAVQTPQAFRLDVLAEAHRRACEDGAEADDDCALVERVGVRVATVAGHRCNVKVTTAEDLVLLRSLLAAG